MAALVFNSGGNKKDAVKSSSSSSSKFQVNNHHHFVVASSSCSSSSSSSSSSSCSQNSTVHCQLPQPHQISNNLNNHCVTNVKHSNNNQSMSSTNVGDHHHHQHVGKTNNQIRHVDLKEKSTIEHHRPNGLSNFKGFISETSKKRIADIITDIEKFDDIEKLYLYLQLPDGSHNNNQEDNDGKKKIVSNPFGKKADSEVIQTYAWIQSHLEEDISVSIPKHEVYEEYRAFCEANKFEKLCVADFGKAMKHVFPQVKPRRLGQRGNSKYCYSGLRKKMLIQTPELPLIDVSEYRCGNEDPYKHQSKNCMVNDVVWNIILEWIEKIFSRKFKTSIDFARFLIETQNIRSELAGELHKTNGNVANKMQHKLQWYDSLSKPSSNGKKHHPALALDSVGVSNQLNGKKFVVKQKKFEQIGNVGGNQENSNKNNNDKITIMKNGKLSNVSNAVIVNGCRSNGVQLLNNNNNLNDKQQQSNNSNFNQNDLSKTDIRASVGNQKMFKIFVGSQQQQQQQQQTDTPSLQFTSVNNIDSQVAQSSFAKYKTLQPKLMNFENKFRLAAAAATADNGESIEANGGGGSSSHDNSPDKRRHSVSTMNFLMKKELEDELEFQANENDKNYKRQMDEKEFDYMAKRRHVENLKHLQHHPAKNVGGKYNNNPFKTDACDLKVNELENEALNEYLNNTNNNGNFFENTSTSNNINNTTNTDYSHGGSYTNVASKDEFVQIRELLENHLARAPNNPANHHHHSATAQNNGHSTLHGLLLNNSGCKDTEIDSGKLCFTGGSGAAATTRTGTNHIQLQSPNVRRNAFIFQPISPSDTPTIPENSPLEMNLFGKNINNGNNKMNLAAMPLKQMTSVSVGPSQPSSEVNSPFISPSNTPVSFGGGSRSRNNSGQSAYSGGGGGGYRQTPLQSFDSGVSSISSSPFISPQSTPIPSVRMRPIDNIIFNNNSSNNNMPKANSVARVRHSSGPGGPVSRSQMTNLMSYNRSNSLSPMIINENGNPCFSQQNYVQTTFNIMDPYNKGGGLLVEDNGNDLNRKMSVVTQTENPPNTKDNDSNLFFNFQMDFTANNKNVANNNTNRQRHFSNPYGGVSTAVVKNNDNNDDNDDDFKMLLNRSQSVPLNPMFESSQLNGFTANNNDDDDDADLQQGTSMMPEMDGNINGDAALPSDNDILTSSKSYPSATTTMCNNELSGMSNANSSRITMNEMISNASLDDLLTNHDNVIQSGQDLIVSSVHLNSGVQQDINQDSNQPPTTLNVTSPMVIKGDRNEFNDLLINDSDVEQFQTSLEDAFPDCDNDFSNIDLDNNVPVYGGDYSV